jgi:hypothetical protein
MTASLASGLPRIHELLTLGGFVPIASRRRCGTVVLPTTETVQVFSAYSKHDGPSAPLMIDRFFAHTTTLTSITQVFTAQAHIQESNPSSVLTTQLYHSFDCFNHGQRRKAVRGSPS